MVTTNTAVSIPQTLFTLIHTYLSPAEQQFVQQAYALAVHAHAGFARLDGSPYLEHVTAVAAQLAAWRAPAPVLAAGLLHDIRKERYAAPVSLDEVTDKFGEEVAGLVQAVSRLGRLGTPFAADASESAQERMAAVTAQLPWVALMLQRTPLAVVIKIADKLHNFQSLTVLPPERQLAFATSVMSIFVPFAERLGMREAKRVLEDSAFAVLQPESFAAMQQRYPEAARLTAVQPIITQIQQALAAEEIEAQVFSRHRSLADLYHLETGGQAAGQAAGQTGSHKQIPLHLADPIIILTTNSSACYRALGAVHALWEPEPGKIWDYIASPKPNGYRGLHTRLHLRDGEWLVAAIRDLAMDVVADYGVTAVWRGIPVQIHSTFPAWEEPPLGKIGVLTPDGEFVTLPTAATPVDFAYAIHMGLGHQCTGALVNGKQASLDWPLETGDVVRILTGNVNVGPSPEWLTFVKTPRARSAIRRWLKAEKPDDAAESGWQQVDEQLRQAGLTLAASPVRGRLTAVAPKLGYHSRDDLLLAVGLGQVEAAKVVKLLQEVADVGDGHSDGRPLLRATILSVTEADMSQRLAACCRPAPPDAIVGYVTKAGFVSIHRADCAKVRQLRPLIQADWPRVDLQPRGEIYLSAVDRPGLVRDVSQVAAESDISMISFHADRMDDGSARILIGLGDVPRWQTDRLVAQLEGIADVRLVERRAPSPVGEMWQEMSLAHRFENPYTLRPVSGSGFYGRKRELRELINHLRDARPGEAVLLWGPRRIGKTSLLLKFQQEVMASEDYVRVFVDMQLLSGSSTTFFIRDILRAFAGALGHPEIVPRINRLKRDPLGYFRSFFDNSPYLQNKYLVLIIDEFQLLSTLTEEEVTLADINRTLRSLIQHRQGLSIIFSGGGVLADLLRQPETSFMLEVARFQKVDCLDEVGARELIIEPAPHITYSETAVNNLLFLTARHPYYLQWLCGELISQADKEQQATIGAEQVESLLVEWLPGQGEQFFNHLWGSSTGFTRAQQFVSKLVLTMLAAQGGADGELSAAAVEAVALPDNMPHPRDVLQSLAQMDTVSAVNDQYRIKMPLFRRWLQANYAVEQVLKEWK